MLNLLNQYILVWQLPVALAIASLAILPIRVAFRKMRIGDLDMLDHGAVEHAFLATLCIGVAAIFYPYILVLILGVWISFFHRRMMTIRAWMSSLLALTLCTFWYFLIHHYL